MDFVQPGEPVDFVQLRETHSGVVLLYGDRAYKTKKPIATDFLDFSTHARRERACARELELNRRMSPDVYLGVAHLDDPAGGPAEPVLVMRRMPEDRRLSNTLSDPDAGRGELSALARTLAAFHAAAARGPDIDAEGTPRRLRARWDALITPLRTVSADIVDTTRIDRVRYLAGRYIDGRTALLHNRIDSGRIVDGHGDLLAEDIFDLPDGFRVLDCLEFDDRLRYVDVIDDIAFLAMDLEFRGHREPARQFLLDYVSAAADPAPVSLIDHYIAYRAMVRAKVDIVRLAQGDVTARPRALHHLDIAVRHLEHSRIRLALVGGLPGTGKSTLARALAAEVGAVVISSDTVRRQLRDAGTVTGEIGHFGEGAYAAAAKTTVYTEMLARARSYLAHGVSVILDASWTSAAERTRATELAAELAVDVVEIRCECPQSEAARRIEHRADGDSDATAAIAAAMSTSQSPWLTASIIDTSAAPDAATADALRVWRGSRVRERCGAPVTG